VRIEKLVDVAPIVNNRICEFEGERPYLSTGGLKGESYKTVNVKYLKKPSRADITVESDDIFMARMHSTLKVLQTSAKEKDLIISTGFVVFRPRKDILYPRYLYHYLKTKKFQFQKDKKCTGATQKAINNSNISDLTIPIISLTEQIRISEKLDLAISLRQKRTKSIKLLDDYLRSTFLEMFGDPVVNPKGWDKDLLKSKIAFLTSGSRGWAKYYSNQGTLFLRIQNIGRNKLILGDLSFVDAPDTQEANRTKALPRDLILTITADLGRTAIIPNNFEEAYINQHLALVRLKEINPYFISGYLSTDAGKSLINKSNKGGVKAGLNFNDIKSLPILMPPLELQDKYEHIYHQVDKLKAKYKESEKELDNLFGSLSQKAFKGEL